MRRIELKKLIETEIKAALQEEVVEPSEMLIKGVQKELKLKTGIIAVLGLDKRARDAYYYTSDLTKELRTPVLNAIFSSMTLDITATKSEKIGGYAFSVSINYTHPQGGTNGKYIGTIIYENNTFKSRFV